MKGLTLRRLFPLFLISNSIVDVIKFDYKGKPIGTRLDLNSACKYLVNSNVKFKYQVSVLFKNKIEKNLH